MDAREAVARLAPTLAMLAAIVAARARALTRAMYGAMTTNALVSGGLMFSLSRYFASVGRALARRAVVAVDRAVFMTFVVARGAYEDDDDEYEDVRAFVEEYFSRESSTCEFRARYAYEGFQSARASEARKGDSGTPQDRSLRGVRLDALVGGSAIRTRVDGKSVRVAHRSGNAARRGDGDETDGSWYDDFVRQRERNAPGRGDGDSLGDQFEVKMYRLFQSEARMKERLFELMKRGRAAKKKHQQQRCSEHTSVYMPKTVTQYHETTTPGRQPSHAQRVQQQWILREKPSRPLETVVLPPGARERLVADVDDFLSSERWYVNRGLPWHRGYLLHGLPGTGKTSLVFALAGHFKLPLYTIRLSDERLDDEGLHWLFSNTQRRSIILLDDVDAPGANAVFREPAPESTGNLSVSSTLSLLDGVTAVDGRLIFLTCRDKLSLNPTLIRPGRFDVLMRFDAPSKEQIAAYYKHFYAECDVADDELWKMANSFAAIAVDVDKMPKSMAALQALFIANKDDPAAALEAMQSRVTQQKSKRVSALGGALTRSRSGGETEQRDAVTKLETIEANE